MDIMGGKITINLKSEQKWKKEETCANQKRARSALSTERMFE
jgi:hypothetical protein